MGFSMTAKAIQLGRTSLFPQKELTGNQIQRSQQNLFSHHMLNIAYWMSKCKSWNYKTHWRNWHGLVVSPRVICWKPNLQNNMWGHKTYRSTWVKNELVLAMRVATVLDWLLWRGKGHPCFLFRILPCEEPETLAPLFLSCHWKEQVTKDHGKHHSTLWMPRTDKLTEGENSHCLDIKTRLEDRSWVVWVVWGCFKCSKTDCGGC